MLWMQGDHCVNLIDDALLVGGLGGAHAGFEAGVGGLARIAAGAIDYGFSGVPGRVLNSPGWYCRSICGASSSGQK